MVIIPTFPMQDKNIKRLETRHNETTSSICQ